MLRLIARIFGAWGWCPGCESDLELHEAGYHICTGCGAVINYAEGTWNYAGESEPRALPYPFGRRAA